MRRSIGVAAVLVALSLVFPAAATAGPPGSRIPPGTVIVDMPAGWICPEAVGEVTWTVLGGNSGSVVKRDGGILSTGYGRVEVRGAATGKSIILMIAGSGTVSPDGSVWTANGKSLWGFFPGDAGPGTPGTPRSYFLVGHATVLVGADSTFFEYEYSGTIMDVCAAIS